MQSSSFREIAMPMKYLAAANELVDLLKKSKGFASRLTGSKLSLGSFYLERQSIRSLWILLNFPKGDWRRDLKPGV